MNKPLTIALSVGLLLATHAHAEEQWFSGSIKARTMNDHVSDIGSVNQIFEARRAGDYRPIQPIASTEYDFFIERSGPFRSR